MTRSAGILMPVSSLPGRYGIGSFGKEAYDFVDFLEAAGQTYWQILPLNPPNHSKSFDSPYQSFSAFAGNPYYISLDALIEEGVLSREECDAIDFGNDPEHVDYNKMYASRFPLLRRAYERSAIAENPQYQRFIRDNAWWLDDFALFMALKAFFEDREWTDWPEDIRLRRPEAYFIPSSVKNILSHIFFSIKKNTDINGSCRCPILSISRSCISCNGKAHISPASVI